MLDNILETIIIKMIRNGYFVSVFKCFLKDFSVSLFYLPC